MAPRKRYQLDHVTVEPGESRPATWTFAGDAVSGTEQSYLVIDGNFPSRNVWTFIVRIPSNRGERLEVRPRTTPSLIRALLDRPGRDRFAAWWLCLPERQPHPEAGVPRP